MCQICEFRLAPYQALFTFTHFYYYALRAFMPMYYLKIGEVEIGKA